MNLEVRTMLDSMYEIFIDKFNDPVKAWDHFIEFLAVDNCAPLICQLENRFEWVFKDSKLVDNVIKTYNSNLLKSDYYDHLGDIYVEKIISKNEAKRKGIYITPQNAADVIGKISIQETDRPLMVLDPAVGTGRLLMAAYKKAPKAALFGVDIDLRSLRIAFTNLAIHNISGYLLHADSLMHEIDISNERGRYNWQFANRWNTCIENLRPMKKQA